jgi:two-component system chemotaxis response regulator CheB
VNRDIVVIGASAGGIRALQYLVSVLPPELPAVVCVVVHIPTQVKSALPAILSKAGDLPARHAQDGEPAVPGAIYVAPPDRHLLLRPGQLRLSSAPRGNSCRPAVDPLFRSAARSYGPRVIGVVLSGMLADGSAGLARVKQHGGFAIAQDPHEAEHPGMPENALMQVPVDFVGTASEIGGRIAKLVGQSGPEPTEGSSQAMPNEPVDLDLPSLDEATHRSFQLDMPSGLQCPACGGALWEKDEAGVLIYRCYLGHSYALANFLASQWEDVEASLMSGIRALRERAAVLRRAASRSSEQPLGARYTERAADFERQAETIERLLQEAGTVERRP